MKQNYQRAGETEQLVNLCTTGQEFITRLRFQHPEITLKEIWDDLNNFGSATMLDNHERKLLHEARLILKHEARTQKMIDNL